MNTGLLALAAELVRDGRAFVVATVVRRESPSSARLGDTAIVTRDGELHGFIGGSCTRATVVHQALSVLERGEPRLISFRDDDQTRADDIVSVPMTCHSGGSVEIYIDPVYPPPCLLVLGSSPVTHAVARLGKAMGYTVHAGSAEDRDDLPGEADEQLDAVDGLAARYGEREPGARLWVLVATMGESDERMLTEALAAHPDYIGVIASRRRMEEVRDELARSGVPEDDIASIHGPAGLDLGAARPEEIALSILAEIVAQERSAPGATVPRTDAAVRGNAIDPVCGMTVAAVESTPQVRHGDTTYYFCCTGCRDRFVVGAEEYVAAAEARAAEDGSP